MSARGLSTAHVCVRLIIRGGSGDLVREDDIEEGNLMRRTRVLAGAGTAFGAATAATALVVGAAAGHAETGTSSAHGVSAFGASDFGPEPYVESTDGSDQHEEVAGFEVENEHGSLGTVDLVGLFAGDNEASAELEEFHLQDPENSESYAAADEVHVSCEGEDRQTTLVGFDEGFTDDDYDQEWQPEPNTEAQPSPNVRVVFNEHTITEDGEYVVRGAVFEDTELDQTVVLGEASCGGAAGQPEEPEKPEQPEEDKPEAPAPEPEEDTLPVTG